MMRDLSFWSFPSLRFPSFDDDDWSMLPSVPSGLSISEDEKHVYIEAAVPGLDADDVDVTFQKGILWIKGEGKEEKKEGKKFYRKASRSFSYRIAVPADVDASAEPEAKLRKGVMHVTFPKSPAAQPKKISIKSED